jgi:hypothetical protein
MDDETSNSSCNSHARTYNYSHLPANNIRRLPLTLSSVTDQRAARTDVRRLSEHESSTSRRCAQEDEGRECSRSSLAFGSDDEDAAVELSEISLSGSQPSSLNDEEDEDAELAEFAGDGPSGNDDGNDGIQHVAARSVTLTPFPSTDLQRLQLDSSAPLTAAVTLSQGQMHATAGVHEVEERERQNASALLRSFVDEAPSQHNALYRLAADGRSAAASDRPSVIPGQRGAAVQDSLTLRYTLNWH